jgi:hypothetical protein
MHALPKHRAGARAMAKPGAIPLRYLAADLPPMIAYTLHPASKANVSMDARVSRQPSTRGLGSA